MNAIITGVSSDIGKYICDSLEKDNWDVYGSFRKQSNYNLERFVNCDFSDEGQIEHAIDFFSKINWDLFISSVGTLEPIGRFAELNFQEWQEAIYINALSQLKLLQGILKQHNPGATVFFFAGAGTNGGALCYSSYCISKIILIKMCELLDEEIDDVKFVIGGPGIIGTKIHNQTLKNKERAEKNYVRIKEYVENEGEKYTESLRRVYEFIKWCISAKKEEVSGRNFSIVNDKWGEDIFRDELVCDTNMYKLRRYRNEF